MDGQRPPSIFPRNLHGVIGVSAAAAVVDLRHSAADRMLRR